MVDSENVKRGTRDFQVAHAAGVRQQVEVSGSYGGMLESPAASTTGPGQGHGDPAVPVALNTGTAAVDVHDPAGGPADNAAR